MTAQILDMRIIRHLNLFSKITGVRTSNCFFYNNFIVFAVPSGMVSKAIGENGKNVKKIVGLIKKKIKIVGLPGGDEGVKKFIEDIVSPITFNDVEITENEITITGNRQSKAMLIGRNKVRLIELQQIVKNVLGKTLKIG